ncbi:hypothetical protein ACVIWU_006579 [Bradyrhizobium sp. USDA 4509]
MAEPKQCSSQSHPFPQDFDTWAEFAQHLARLEAVRCSAQELVAAHSKKSETEWVADSLQQSGDSADQPVS